MIGSGRQYAKHRGCAHTSVIAALRAGRISADASGKINFEQADEDWAANTNTFTKIEDALDIGSAAKPVRKSAKPTAALTDKESGPATFMTAKRDYAVYRAQMAELDLKERRGELISKADVKQKVFLLARQFRDSLSNWADDIAEDMAAHLDCNPHAVRTYLARAIRVKQEEIAGASLRI